LGTVAAVRKGVAPDVAQGPYHELTSALLQKGKKFEAGSLVEVMQGLTPTVAGNISAVVTEMRHTILKSIRDAHSATQGLLTSTVDEFEVKVTSASSKKTFANTQDELLQSCVEQEIAEIDSTITKQNTYNRLQFETEEPCGRELSSAHFTATRDEEISQECDTDADEECALAKQNLATEIGNVKSTMETYLDTHVQLHQQAEKDCEWAEGNASVAKTAIVTQQGVWNSKYDACVTAKTHRNSAVCDFGEKLQDVCVDLAFYNTLVTDTGLSGNIHSVQDRKDEAVAVQTVLCVLEAFIDGDDITEATTAACHNSVSLTEFDLDLLAIRVAVIKAVNDNDALVIKCDLQEIHEFFGGFWDSPIVDPKPDGYEYNTIPSAENVTREIYDFVDKWEQEFDLEDTHLPFPVCSS